MTAVVVAIWCQFFRRIGVKLSAALPSLQRISSSAANECMRAFLTPYYARVVAET